MRRERRAGTLVAVIRPAAARPRAIGRVAVAAVALAALVGCTRDRTVASDAERFCGEAVANRDLILAPPISTEEELTAVLEFHRLMAQLAPLAIATEWAALVHNYEVASELVPGDPASEQRVAMTAYATEPSAYAVQVWLERNCGVELPITTIAPQAPPTVPPPTTPDGGSGETERDG